MSDSLTAVEVLGIAKAYDDLILPAIDSLRENQGALRRLDKVTVQRGDELWVLEVEEAEPTEDEVRLVGKAWRIR